MTRSNARELAVRISFGAEASKTPVAVFIEEFFSVEHYPRLDSADELFKEFPDEKQMEYIRTMVTLIEEHRTEVDAYIERYANGWKLNRISSTALAFMRCAICEILYMEDVPASVAINEAVELDKGYDEPNTVSFVNGVLGAFVRGELNQEN